MSNPIGLGVPIHEPGFYDMLQVFKRNLLVSLNCVKIGQIVSFNAAQRTVSVQLLFQRVLKDGTYDTYPVLTDCPLFICQGGGNALQFPVAAGDQCIVLFSDRNIDAWFAQGSVQPPPDGRLHDVSDGIAVVGLNYLKSTVPAPSTTETRIISADGLTKIGIQGDLITLSNPTGSLLIVLQALINVLTSLTVQVGSNTGVVTTSSQNDLNNVAAQIAALLY